MGCSRYREKFGHGGAHVESPGNDLEAGSDVESTRAVERDSRIAEAEATSQSAVKQAENSRITELRRLDKELAIATANAEKRIKDALTRRNAVVAEVERSGCQDALHPWVNGHDSRCHHCPLATRPGPPDPATEIVAIMVRDAGSMTLPTA